MNYLISWRKTVLVEPTTHNVPGNYALQGSAHDFRGRVQNLAAPIIQFDHTPPWMPQWMILQPFTKPQRVPNPSPGVRKLQQSRGPQRTVGPLSFSPAGVASINRRGY